MSEENVCVRHKQLISFVCAFQNCPNRRMCDQCKHKQNLHFTQHANYIYILKDFYEYSSSKQLVPKLQKGIQDSENFINNHKSFYNEQKRVLSSDFDILAEIFREVSQNYHQIYHEAFEKQMNMFDEEIINIKKLLKEYLYEKNQQESFFSRIFGNQSQDNHQIDDIVKKNAKVFKVRASIINLRSKIAMAKTNKTAYKSSQDDQQRFQELKDHFKQISIGFYDKLKELLNHEGNHTSLRSSIVAETKSLSNSQVSQNHSLNGSQISINSQPNLATSNVSSVTSRSLLSQKQNPQLLHQSRVRVALPEPHPSVRKIIKLLKTIQYPLNLPILSVLNNKKEEGPFKYPLGTYYGTYIDGIRCGKGIFIFNKDGSYYQGTWQKDNLWGYGRLITQNSYYEGQIANGAAFGQGTFQNSFKVYSGEWRCDLRHGRGQEVYKNKRYRYKGNFTNDKYHGYGVLEQDEVTYTGQFKEGVYDGQGTIRYKNGETFSGIFKNGERISGKHLMPDGSYYEGQYENGVPHGRGDFLWPDGVRYIGFWRGGLQQGQGVQVYDGRQQKGLWKNGSWICWR